jgi:hypothetical protein
MDTNIVGYSAHALMNLTGSPLASTRRWKHPKRAPNTKQRLLALALEGNLGAIDQSWHGFVIRGGKIWTPEDMYVTPGDIRAIPCRLALVRELERQLATAQQFKLL